MKDATIAALDALLTDAHPACDPADGGCGAAAGEPCGTGCHSTTDAEHDGLLVALFDEGEPFIAADMTDDELQVYGPPRAS